MRKLAPVVLTILILPSCNDSQLLSKHDKDTSQTEDLGELGAVNEPVMVGGSFLTCGQPEEPHTEGSVFACRIEDETGRKDSDLIAGANDIIATYEQTTLYGEAQAAGDWHWYFRHNLGPGLTFKVKLINSDILVSNSEIEFTNVENSLPQPPDSRVAAIDCSNLQGGSYVAVAGNEVYGTSDFCVMKYEAKNVNGAYSQAEGQPWTTINQVNARDTCRALGEGYELISNDEFLTLAVNIASVANNWSSGAVGAGELNRGHSDGSPTGPCPASADDSLAFVETNCTPRSTGSFVEKRTHWLNSGEIIWDLAGNVWHWVNYVIPDNSQKPFASTRDEPGFLEWREFSELDSGFDQLPLERFRPTRQLIDFWQDDWDSRNSIGQYLQGGQGEGGTMRRGGRYGHGNANGLFAVSLDLDSQFANETIGFRCVYRPNR
ncbi:MAG: hypothetical protein ACOH5I_21390 [Oligoflexus sp.]